MSIKLNLGSHNKDIGNEYINIDALDLPNVDLECDLNIIPFNFKVKKKNKLDTPDWDFLFEDHLSGRTEFTLKNNFADEIVMEEVLEHISFRNTVPVLKEMFRVLKVGGKLRIQVPDCEAAMRAYIEKKICTCVPHKALVADPYLAFKGKPNCPICKGTAVMDPERFLYSFTGAQKHKYDIHLAIFTRDILTAKLREAGITEYKFIDNPIKLKVEIIK